MKLNGRRESTNVDDRRGMTAAKAGGVGIVGIIVYVLIFMSLRRNEYRIEGNTLIVREYKFTRLDTDLRIPINTIEQVYIKNHYTLFPRLILEIGGLQRELRCISHPESLALAILQRQSNIPL